MLLDDIEQHLADIESVSEEIREKAILALGTRTDVQAIIALKKAAREDEDLRLRNLARKCLMDLKKEITSVSPELFDEDDDRHLNLQKLKLSLSHSDVKVRLNAVKSTVSFKEKKAVGILHAALSEEIDPTVKGSMLIAMGILGRAEVIPLLTGVLKKEKDPLIRKSAIDGLVYCKDITVYPTILKIFVTDRDKLVERACLKALNTLGKGNLLKLLARMVGSSQASKREVAVRTLGRFNSDTTVTLLEKVINDPEETVRKLVHRNLLRLAKAGNAPAKALAEKVKLSAENVPGAEDGSVIIEAKDTTGLDDADPNVRLQTIQAVANSGDMLKFAQLRERLKAETHDYVKAAVVTALYRLGGRAAIPILKECLGDKVDRARANAVEALAKVGDEANFPLFIPLLKDPDGRTRANAIVALKKCSYIDPAQTIQDMIQSREEKLIRSAMHAIVEIGSDKAVSLLGELVGHENEGIRDKALESLELLRDRNNSAARKLLVKVKGERKGEERRATRKATAMQEAQLAAAEAGGAVGDASGRTPRGTAKLPYAETVKVEPAPEVREAAPPAPLTVKAEPRPEPRAERDPASTEEPPPPPPPRPTRPAESLRAEPKPPPPPDPPTREKTKAMKPADAPKAGFKLPFDTSQGIFSFATFESMKNWWDRLPPLWRIAMIAVVMVWGMVLLMFVIQIIRGEDAGASLPAPRPAIMRNLA